MARPGARVFCLGSYSIGHSKEFRAARRRRYNTVVREYCSRHPELFTYVNVDAIVPPDTLVDNIHYSRRGTVLLGQHILAVLQGHEPLTYGERIVEEEEARDRARRAEKVQRRTERRQERTKGDKNEKRSANAERRAERAQRREQRQKVQGPRRSETTAAE